MKYINIKSDSISLNVSKISMGTAPRTTESLNEKEIFYLMDMFMETGGNCLDTARAYNDGRSEEVIGKWMKKQGNRDRVIISTKGGYPKQDCSNRAQLSRKEIEDDLNLSLKALQTDYIDIYWLHRDDPEMPVEEIIESINIFCDAGKIKLVGCSNWHVDRIQQANEYAEKNGKKSFAASQIKWSLAETFEEYYKEHYEVVMDDREYRWYYKKQIPVFAYGSQALGFFAKAASSGIESLNEEILRRYGSEKNIQRFEKVTQFAAQHSVSVSSVVFGYITCNKLPSVAVFGARNPEQLRDVLQFVDLEMDSAEADSLYNA
jgi:aryl-alcohol dehydrogenase-like predicted oxidoreductase